MSLSVSADKNVTCIHDHIDQQWRYILRPNGYSTFSVSLVYFP